MTAGDAVEQAYREHWARLLARLVTWLRRFDLAEDSLQDAYASAARVWPEQGVPANPAGWLLTAARRRALDLLRREDAARRRLPLLVTGDGPAPRPEDPEGITDERLRLLFACCHPALSADARRVLMLRFGAGLRTAEIARLFQVAEPTLAARLTRAKAKIAQAGIPLRQPGPADLPARLTDLRAAVYLLFSEGYRATADLQRPRLAAEAIRLAYLLPPDAETAALLALMLLHHARRDARTDGAARLVRLADQDRTRWHHGEIARGLDLLATLGDTEPGDYHLQALIAAEHCRADGADRHRVAKLYAELERRTGSAVVRLNRAVAVAEAGSPEAGLSLLDGIEVVLPAHHLVPAARAELLLRAGRPADAVAAFDRALDLVRTDAEREHLARRRRMAQEE